MSASLDALTNEVKALGGSVDAAVSAFQSKADDSVQLDALRAELVSMQAKLDSLTAPPAPAPTTP